MDRRGNHEYERCMSSDTQPASFSISSDDIVRWEEEARDEDSRAAAKIAEAAAHTQRGVQLRLQAAKARELVALITGAPPPAEVRHDAIARRNPKAYRPGSWREWVKDRVYGHPDGITSAQLRELIQSDPDFLPKFVESDKGYYNAVFRLKGDGVITLEDGRYYSPEAWLNKLAAFGEGKDRTPAYRSSPLGDAILDLVYACPGIAGGEVVKALREDEEFAASVRYNSAVYNVLARLAGREQVVNAGNGYTPGPKMPARNPDSKWVQIGAHLAGGANDTQREEFTLN